MGKLIYVTGGSRSGKSEYAEKLAMAYPSAAYIATAKCCDSEMQERIRRHRARRPEGWRTIESYADIAEQLQNVPESVALIDCITVMVTNLMFDAETDWDNLPQERINEIENMILDKARSIAEAAHTYPADVILVTGELGMGVVPAYALGRIFRDIAGRANQILATAADEAWFVVSGIPMLLKGEGRHE
jgi:adenosylcobinamide kinase/adenosylcobinamide-phosphate guanylyltransferase